MQNLTSRAFFRGELWTLPPYGRETQKLENILFTDTILKIQYSTHRPVTNIARMEKGKPFVSIKRRQSQRLAINFIKILPKLEWEVIKQKHRQGATEGSTSHAVNACKSLLLSKNFINVLGAKKLRLFAIRTFSLGLCRKLSDDL